MKYLLIENEEGIYAKNGKNYDILECNDVIGPRASEFKEYKNLNNAIRYFGLTIKENIA